ncbi:MAG: DNA polymerase III subunit [Candidatus Uhrbacteria bacterium]|nr:DNA polymerase III subunit [Candidatus Uhrbacteria bacterium]
MTPIFSSIIGHTAQKEYLGRVIQKETLAHAYCFSGPKHVGKRAVVEEFVREALGVDLAGTPDSLKKRGIETNPNVTIVKPSEKGSISVEDIRILKERLSMSSFGSGKKVAIIEDADTMTIPAQNALLKTLEEPSGESLIILVASSPELLLRTILSRTVHIRFTLSQRNEIEKFLLAQGSTKELAHELAGLAGGRPGVANALINKDLRARFLEDLGEALQFAEGSLASRFAFIERIVKDKERTSDDLEKTIDAIRQVLHDCALASLGATDFSTLKAEEARVARIVQMKPVGVWAKALRTLGEAEYAMRANVNAQLALEHFALAL